MARPKGIIRYTGSLGELSSYSSVFGPILRTKGGASKEKIRNDPNFARVREHNSEFGDAVKSAQVLKQAIRPLLLKEKDHTLAGRMNQLMYKLKEADMTSPRGKRTAGTGLLTAAGISLLRGFEFNGQTRVSSLLNSPYQANTTNGEISFNKLDLYREVNWPAGATHVQLQGAWSKIDLDQKVFESHTSSVITLSKDNGTSHVQLLPTGAPGGTGVDIFLLKVSFVQVVNSALFRLNSKNFSALGIIEVS